MQTRIPAKLSFFLFILLILLYSCQKQPDKIKVILDTDTNNELDDQHALAYLLFNGRIFDVPGITVNATRSGGNIDSQYAEAKRIMELCRLFGKIPLYKGADSSFDSIYPDVYNESFDGSDAVNFIIKQSHDIKKNKLTVIAVGKLTNIALALKKDTSIAPKVRLVWLGSNYPEAGEYNLDNDTSALNFILNSQVQFEIVTVRYNRYTGTSAVSTTREEIKQKMPKKGPSIVEPVQGRDGNFYSNFGDYSVSLFENIGGYGPDFSRPLYDMAAVAIIKNPSFASSFQIPAPLFKESKWIERKSNKRVIRIWEHFDKESIMNDFYYTMNNYVLVESK